VGSGRTFTARIRHAVEDSWRERATAWNMLRGGIVFVHNPASRAALPVVLGAIVLAAPLLAEHHHHRAPHGGTLIELGEEAAHLELVIDRRSGGLAVYVLDGEAERAVKVAQPQLDVTLEGAPARVVLRAAANVLTGETVGNSSQFAGRHGGVKVPGPLRGTIGPVTVRGVTYPALAFVVPGTPARQ
jgi:hypothetical protein